jgi:AcrR family transcriptional regulator
MSVRVDRLDTRRQAIVGAALALADSDGVVAVTMRGVAERLGLGTMTLYSYVGGKDELIDRMVDAVVGEMLVPEPMPPDWRGALRAIALRTHDVFARHPWIFETARRPRGANVRRHVEQSLAAVAPLGADEATAAAILAAVDDYTIGHALRAHGPQSDFERGLGWLLDGIAAELDGGRRAARLATARESGPGRPSR